MARTWADIEKTTKEIFVTQLGIADKEFSLNASVIEDFGADSLDVVELVMSFEESFDTEISDSEAEHIIT
jgi:acyl carrier protein